MRRLYKPRVGWAVPTAILVLGWAPIFALELFGIERSISTFPEVLGSGVIAWTPRDGPFILVAGVIPFVLAYAASKAQALFTNPVPAVAVCLVLAPLPVFGAALFHRGGGEAILEDKVVFRDAAPWGERHEEHLITAIQIEKGCAYGRRGRNPIGIYNIVFASGRRFTLGSSQALNYGFKKPAFLAMVHRVDSLPSLSAVQRRSTPRSRGPMGIVNDPGCLDELATSYPAEDRQTVFRVYSP